MSNEDVNSYIQNIVFKQTKEQYKSFNKSKSESISEEKKRLTDISYYNGIVLCYK